MVRSPKFGVFVPQGWKMDLVEIDDPVAKYEAMTAVAKAADAEPTMDSIWVYDHFHTIPEPTLETTFECWTITATLARDTERVRIGQMVGCNGYRNPALYAKIASTVDVASHGRLERRDRRRVVRARMAGLRLRVPGRAGADAHAPRGVPDHPRDVDRGLRHFEGKRYQINGAINEPKGVQKPHMPLWIGGGGEKVTLKLVAQYGDACNVGGGDPETCRQKLEILEGPLRGRRPQLRRDHQIDQPRHAAAGGWRGPGCRDRSEPSRVELRAVQQPVPDRRGG